MKCFLLLFLGLFLTSCTKQEGLTVAKYTLAAGDVACIILNSYLPTNEDIARACYLEKSLLPFVVATVSAHRQSPQSPGSTPTCH